MITQTAFALSCLAVVTAHLAEDPINPLLGVPGFPDCVNPSIAKGSPVEQAAQELVCKQKGGDGVIKIGTVGDSITAGVHSSGGNHTYPGQLQILLDNAYPGKYQVTNLGACGSTMLNISNSPYWRRPQFKTLRENKWDIIIIMLGTNDAKDPGDGGPNNWLHNCGGPDHTTLDGCTFANDYLHMIEIIKTLGTTPAGPKIYTAIPPPLMKHGSIGANQTVINSVYSKLIPMINTAAKVNTVPIDIYTAMGGTPTWSKQFPENCSLDTAKTWLPCAWWCDAQSCDQCHPNNNGYTHMANAMLAGLGLAGTVCESTEYCCPDAKHCLTPTSTSCVSNANACAADETCCPLTKICVKVGKPCMSPCADQGSYCCPDAKHCLTPTNPGVFCSASAPCKSNEVCCPLTHLCVSVGEACYPPELEFMKPM